MHRRVKQILAEIKDQPDLCDALDDHADIVNSVALDSLQMISFIMRTEQEFGIQFDYDTFDFSHLSSIDRLCQFIKTQAPVSAS